MPTPIQDPGPEPSSSDVERTISLLRSAQKPIVIAGSGVWWADAGAELQQFIERTSLPLYTITMAKGVVSDEHPLCLGYADPALNPAVQTAFKEADLFLVLGKRLDYRLALGGPRLFGPGKFVQVDIHAQELGLNHRLELGIWADVRRTLRALLAAAGETSWKPLPWLDRVRDLRSDWQSKLAATAEERSAPMHPAAFFAELKKWLPADVPIMRGTAEMWSHWGRATSARPSSRPLVAPGTAGHDRLGASEQHRHAAGESRQADPADHRRRFARFLHRRNGHSGAPPGLPVVMIVGNDGGWGLERELQGATAGSTVACELRRTRYDEVMKGFGGGGETVDTLDQVRPAVERAAAVLPQACRIV